MTARGWLFAITAACVAGVAAALLAQYRFDMRKRAITHRSRFRLRLGLPTKDMETRKVHVT